MVNIVSDYPAYLEALLEGDYESCSEVVKKLLAEEASVQTIYQNLFQRSMYEVGSLWENNKIPISKEHLATSTTESLLSLVYPKIFSGEHIDKRALVSCAVNEYHQLGGRMVADIFEMNGWNSHFLGSSRDPEYLVHMALEKKPDLVALSVSISHNIPGAEKVVNLLRDTDFDGPILLGGQAFKRENYSVDGPDGVQVVNDLNELDDIIRKLSLND